MSWHETESLSFLARHEEEDAGSAERILDSLEELRLRLEDRFEETPGDITVVVHPTPTWLSAAHPFLPAARLAAAPAGRRYLAGWAMAHELHVLSDACMEARAAGEDSLAALLGTADRLYVQLVLALQNPKLPPPWGPRRFARYLRWAWLIEGGAQYFAGQAHLFRAAAATRLRQGSAPSFPPSARDAIILGWTVLDLLERRRGIDACIVLVSRLRRDGVGASLEIAFGEPVAEVERHWRERLVEIRDRRLDADLPIEEPEVPEVPEGPEETEGGLTGAEGDQRDDDPEREHDQDAEHQAHGFG